MIRGCSEWEQKMVRQNMGTKDKYVCEDVHGYLEKSVFLSSVTSWSDMEAIWHHTFYNNLCVGPEDQAVMMIYAPTQGDHIREVERTAMAMFATMDVPMMSVVSPKEIVRNHL